MPHPLSIVHLTTYLQGGAGRAIADLACAQHRAGHDVLVVASETGQPGYGNYPQHLDRLREASVPLLLVDSLFTRDPELNRFALERLLAVRPAARVDLVHAHAATPARIAQAYVATTPRRVPVIQTQHGWGINKTAEQTRDDLAVLREIDHVVVTSEATGAWLVSQGLDRSSVTTIPCGIDACVPEPAPEACALVASLHRAGLYVVGCAGSITTNKNQRALLKVLARREMLDVAALFVGEGEAALREMAHELGVADRVHTVGYRADGDAWVGAFDLLAVPSLTEGQGLVVLEAFRAGVPVVASDIPALRLLVEDGRTGWLFDPTVIPSFADAMRRARGASGFARSIVRERARLRFHESFTLERMVAAHEALYASLRGDAHPAQIPHPAAA